jgi:putative transposase
MLAQRGPGQDYSSAGSYFVTIVTRRRMNLFGDVSDGTMRLNEWGTIARAEWLKTASIRREIALDEFVVMPNHAHAIVIIMADGNGFAGATGRPPLRPGQPNGPEKIVAVINRRI